MSCLRREMSKIDQQGKYTSPHRVNIWGRKRYSVETNANDYLDYSLDDLWKSVSRLWVLTVLIGLLHVIQKRKEG